MKKRPELIEVPRRKLLCASGDEEPGSAEFQAVIGALFGMAWTLKMARKASGAETFKLSQLEGAYGPAAGPGARPGWTLAIEVPDFITAAEVKRTASGLAAKGKPEPVHRVSLAVAKKQRCVQMLHVGPYSEEQPAIDALSTFAANHGLALDGPHREIYYSDPHRIAPEKLKTLLRYAVRPL